MRLSGRPRVVRIRRVDRALVSAVAHRWHRVAAPVSDENLRRLIGRLELPGGARILDLGCGFGEWLLAALEAVADAHGVGIDTSVPALEQARSSAEGRKLSGRVTFEEADAADWKGGNFDAVLCVGATHALGGLATALPALRRHLRPGGRVLLGEGVWEVPPSPEALAGIQAEPGELPELPELIADLRRFGFEPGFGHVSTPAEWDSYEWSWTGALAGWALEDRGERAEALEIARTHRREWLAGYRGQLGFVTLVLHDLGDDGAPWNGPPAGSRR
jgi:SAM-dependent methyltransferase